MGSSTGMWPKFIPYKLRTAPVLINNHPKTNPIKKVKVLLSHAKDSLKKVLKEGQVGIAKGYLNIPSETGNYREDLVIKTTSGPKIFISPFI